MRIIIALILLLSLSNSALSLQSTDVQIKSQIIEQSISSYLESTGNCPCPYNRDKAGRLCEKRSAWSKPGGNSPICYPNDVTNEMLKNYKDSTDVSNHGGSATEGSTTYKGNGTEDDAVRIKQ